MSALLLALVASMPPGVRDALASAAPLPGASLEVLDYLSNLPPGCEVVSSTTATAPARDGRVLLRLTGDTCIGTATARVRFTARVLVATRDINAGEPLRDAAVLEVRDVTALHAPLVELPAAAVAGRRIRAGESIVDTDVKRPGPVPGDGIQVIATSGPITVRESGRVVPCAPGRTCAVVAGGRRVAGRIIDGALFVEVP